jgi:hypothetical protein
MKDTLHLVQDTFHLTCKWVPTGDERKPLACVWTEPKNAQAAITSSSNDEAGRMPQCA